MYGPSTSAKKWPLKTGDLYREVAAWKFNCINFIYNNYFDCFLLKFLPDRSKN